MRKRLVPLLGILLLAPWPAACLYDGAKPEPEAVKIEAIQPSSAPSWKVYAGVIGGVTSPVDLFYIDITNNAADVLANLYLTNADELSHYYRYMILKVGVYRQTGADWQKAVKSNGEPFPDTYLTMENGRVSFTLPGYARYKVTIDSGSFYCFRTPADGSDISPRFYLDCKIGAK